MTPSSPKTGTELLLLVLSQLPGIGAARMNALIARYGPDPALLDAGHEVFEKVPGIGPSLALDMSACLGRPDWRLRARESAEKELERLASIGASVMTIRDPAYPRLLREIHDPPPLLFLRGALSGTTQRAVAVVGTRRATLYGKQAADLFCRDLVLNGYTIVSGLAYGIDMAAHRSALNNGGATIAVLAGGIDMIYTDPSGKLWPGILEKGAIISEEWLGTEPLPGNFPKRNRLIAGLASGTLVIESDITGGAMITAACALEQNREVFAVPGSIFSRTSRGTNWLIQQSQAKSVMSAGDILTELAPQEEYGASRMTQTTAALQPGEKAVLDALGEEPMHIDALSEKTGLAIASLMVHLFELELRRMVIQQPGQFFQKRTLIP